MSLLSDIAIAIKTKLGGTSINNTIPRYDGTTCTLKKSDVTISDTNVVTAGGGFVGNLTGTASNATLAASATKLATARTINGVAFDGTANIIVEDSTKLPTAGGTIVGALRINGLLTANAGFQGHYISTDNRGVKPNATPRPAFGAYFTSQGGLTGTSNTVYGDLLTLNSYGDASGGLANALFFAKNSKAIFHYQAPQDATTWGAANQIAYVTDNVASATTATTANALVGDETNWASYRSRSVANMLSWKNYGNGHCIFDASNSTAPNGVAVNNTNAQIAWGPAYPTLMGWNGANTYGVRVDSARVADSATTAGRAYPRRSDGADLNFYWAGQGGQPTWLWGGTDGVNMYVYNPSNFSVNYANSAGSVSASAIASGTAGIGTGEVGSYAFMEYISTTISEAGANIAGGTLRYSCVSGTYKSSASTIPSGTWRAMGRVREGYTTLFLRIA